jgi:5-methyltetrahydropteroyltriglutamate--homocysteine methyltransferase
VLCSDDRIVTTHAGSLIRRPEIIEIMRAVEHGQPYDEQRSGELLASAVADVVREQAAIGIDIPSDGEFGKHGWIRYVRERLDGLESTGQRDGPSKLWSRTGMDQARFSGFYERYNKLERIMWMPADLDPDKRPAQTGSTSWICTGPIRYKGQEALGRDLANFRAALNGVDTVDAFLPVVAPASAELHLEGNEYYATEEQFLFAIAEALREEYRAIVDAGFIVQVDDAMLPMRWISFDSLEEYRRWARVRIEALNHALEGLPEERVRYHVCWGSQNVPHTWDIPLRDLVDLILGVNAGCYSLEAGNPRHEHEWQVWREVKLPDGKKLIPGVISHSTNVVEHPELIALRLENFASVVGRENVIAGTDCGFSQNWDLPRMHVEVQWAKLDALVAGAQLASERLWPKAA